MELYELIRKANRDEGLGIRALALRFGVHRRTVRDALSSATPAERKVPERTSPALGPWQGTIRGWLSDDLTAPRKQRHTAHRVWERLTHECGAEVAEATVRAHVAKVRFELDNHARAVTVPQTHGPGEELLCGKPHRASSPAATSGRSTVTRSRSDSSGNSETT